MSGELAGCLRERVTIERRDPARDALGAASGAWTTVRDAWAEIAPRNSGPVAEADAKAAMPRWAVTLRNEAPAPSIGDRLLWRGRYLRVRAIETDPRMPDRITLDTEENR